MALRPWRENVGDRFGADSVLRILAPHRASMSAYERALYDYNVAVVRGTPEERFQLDEKLVSFAPNSEFLFCRARDALESGHPADAMSVLERLDDNYSWMRLMAPPLGFRVRAQSHARGPGERRHAAHVVFERVEVNDQRRGVDLVERCADRCRDDVHAMLAKRAPRGRP